MMRRALVITVALLAASPANAQDKPIRIWGPPAMRGIAQRWADAYRTRHPGVRFELTMRGSDTAIPGLYGGAADIAMMGRPDDAVDDAGFSRPLGYPLTRVEIANGAVSAPGKSDAIAILVNVANPLMTLTLAQLRRIVDCGDGTSVVRTWGDLGLKGPWAARPIHVHAYDFAGRTGIFFQHVVAADSRKMCWDRVVEHDDERRLDGTISPAAERIGEAARTDPDALAIADAGEAHDGLKLVALTAADGPPALPTEAAVIKRRYPLARRAYAFLNRKPGTATDPRIAAFLDWVLSPSGQALLREDGGYLPLDPATAAAQQAIVAGHP